MIPAEHLNDQRRVQHTYIFHEKTGEVQPWIDLNVTPTIPSIYSALLPYHVTSPNLVIDMANDGRFEEIANWIAEYCYHPWQMWMTDWKNPESGKRQITFMFENLSDATIFKLGWS